MYTNNSYCFIFFWIYFIYLSILQIIPFIIVPRTFVNTSDTCILYVSVLTLPPTMPLVSNIEESKDKQGKNNKYYINSHVLKHIHKSDLKWKFIMKCMHDQLLHVSIDFLWCKDIQRIQSLLSMSMISRIQN